MPLDGAYRQTLIERVQSYNEGRTGDGSALQGSTDQRLYLVPQIENPDGDWIDDPAGTPIVFTFDGKGSAFEPTESGSTELEELVVVTAVELSLAGAYSFAGHSWTIASWGSVAAASAEHAFTYVLNRHVE